MPGLPRARAGGRLMGGGGLPLSGDKRLAHQILDHQVSNSQRPDTPALRSTVFRCAISVTDAPLKANPAKSASDRVGFHARK